MSADGWNEVTVTLRYRDGALTPGGVSRDEPETVGELVKEIDRSMNATHFGGEISLSLSTVKALPGPLGESA